MFLRKTKAREPLPITMTGVRMGERLLQIGVDDPVIVGGIAAKVGLSGTAAIAVADDRTATRANAAATRAGTLIEVTVAPIERLPYPEAAFDVVVVHATKMPFGEPTGMTREGLGECLRVLRGGGRLVAVTAGEKSGLSALFRSASAVVSADSAIAALESAGFRPVRVVGELDGLRYIEGIRA